MSASYLGVEHESTVESLTEVIKRWVQHKTYGRVWNLAVVVESGAVCITGRCRNYYTKQLALHAALEACAAVERYAAAEVRSDIEVQ